MTQDPAGQLHVLVPQITADGSRLLYASSDNGTQWSQSQYAFEPLAQQVRAAVGADHTGVAVWHGSGERPSNIYAMAYRGRAAAGAHRERARGVGNRARGDPRLGGRP